MTQTLPPTRRADAVTIRGYRPTDHNACRALWAELTAEHRRRYPGSAPPAGPAVPVEPGGTAEMISPAPPPSRDLGVGFEEYLTRLDLSGMWVAEDREEGVVGFVGLILRGRLGAVEPVVVTEHRRGQGIGRGLLGYLAEQARRRGLRELAISPALRNVEAIHCLQRSGYDTVASVTLTLDLTGRRADRRDGIELHGVSFSY